MVFLSAAKKERKSDCGEWQWSVCVANEGDCGLGTREGSRTGTDCKQTIKTQRCKIPCNWKKKFGGEGWNKDFQPKIKEMNIHNFSFVMTVHISPSHYSTHYWYLNRQYKIKLS